MKIVNVRVNDTIFYEELLPTADERTVEEVCSAIDRIMMKLVDRKLLASFDIEVYSTSNIPSP